MKIKSNGQRTVVYGITPSSWVMHPELKKIWWKKEFGCGELWKLACLFKTKTILRLALAKITITWDNGQQRN